MNKMYLEKDLDSVIERAFLDSNEFVAWFLSKTKFSQLQPKPVWSRSDHPWCKISFTHIDKDTGEELQISRESETDILVVMESSIGQRFAFHIENKLAAGKFTPYQPEMYGARAKHWLNQEKYGGYSDFETILFAPLFFYKKNLVESKLFDRYISYEEASIFIPELRGSCQWPI